MNLGSHLSKQWHNVVEEVKVHFQRISILIFASTSFRFFPFLAWKDELKKPGTLRADFMAGVIGAIIVLPQGIAFAMIAGLPPVYGLYTAMITPIVAGLFVSVAPRRIGPNSADFIGCICRGE